MLKESTQVKKGFTLMETLLATTILMIVVSGVLGIASKSLYLTYAAREQITAFYLAQEPIEYIRFIRDSNRLNGFPWLQSLAECQSATGNLKCVIDTQVLFFPPTASTIRSCPVAGCVERLRYETVTRSYTYTVLGTVATKYIRTTSITTPIGGNPDEARIDVTVSWTTNGVVRSVALNEYIYNW